MGNHSWQPKVVFVGYDGTIWRTTDNGNPRIALNIGDRLIDHGELFT